MAARLSICVSVLLWFSMEASYVDAKDPPSAVVTTLSLRHPKSVRFAVFSSDGTRIATAAADGAARIWDAASGRLLHTMIGTSHGKESRDVLFSLSYAPDGSRVAGRSADEHVYLWNPTNGKAVAALCGRKWSFNVATFSPDSRHLLTVEYGKAKIHDAVTGKRIITLQGNEDDWVETASYSEDGRRIVTSTEQGYVTIWDVTRPEKLRVFSRWSGGFYYARLDSDGRRVATISSGRRARVWDASAAKELCELPLGPSGAKGARIATFSPDGSRVLTVNQQTVGRLWDANTGKLVAALEGHTEAIRSATFSPDGQRIATAAADDSARVWDAKTGKVLRVLTHSDYVYTVRFSPDGARVVTASKDGTARVWSIGTR